MSNTTKVISGGRCRQDEIISEAINWLESQKNDSYISDDLAIIVQVVGGEK